MKKIAGIRKKLDGLASNNSQTDGGSSDTEVNDHLSANQFVLAKVGRYGFPYRATCIALDPVQKLLAIGTDNGSIRICGKPGVEYHVQHDTKPNEKAVVTLLHFLINEGGLVSVVRKMVNSEMVDCSLHIWSIRQNHPALIQSLNFKNQRITALHSPFGCKWLYVGTERGNVFMVNVESFHISGYVIYWNNVVDVSHKTHPGAVINIQTNPVDPNKLLLNYDSEVCVLWDLRAKKYLYQYTPEEATKFSTCLKWHSEGKQFMCGNYDGSLATWNFKNVKKPDEHQTPHGGVKSNKENIVCCPITKLEWLVGESSLIVFSGGMAYGNQNKGLTIMRGRSKGLILSDYVVDFACLVSSPVQTEIPQPQALFVLLKNEIVVFDLTGSVGPSLPWYSLPYTFNIHESPVTCLQFYPECPSDLLFALHGLASQQNQEQANRSKKPWPLNGGTEGEVTQDPAIIITGHADGTVKFWDATSSMLIPCAKLRLSRLFNKDMSRQSSIASNNSKISDLSDDPFAIQHITLCPYGRVLSVVCQSYFLVVFKFNSKESSFETPKVDVNFLIEVASECNESPTSLNDAAMGDHFADHPNLSKSPSSHRLSSCSLTLASHPPLRSGGLRWEVGFQPALLCKQVAYEPMPNISSVAISSAYGLVCFGNSIGLAVVDYLQKCVVTVVMNYELGVPGEWTPDSAVVAKTPIGQTRSNPLSQGYEASNGFTPSAVEHSTKKDRMDKRKERNSRMQYLNEHPKLTKRNSQRSSNGNIHGSTGSVSQDQIDSMFDKRDEPSAGSIQSLLFAYSYTRKSSNLLCPAVWVGTSVGDVSVLALSIPTIGSQRLVQPVLALNTGTNINCGNCVLHLAALDRSGNICNQPFEFWRDANAPNPDADRSNIQTINAESTARQFLCIATEKRIVVKSLPNFKRLSQIDPVAGSDHAEAFVVKAQTMTVNDGNCIGCLTTDGHFKIYSLPSLRMLLNVECGLADYRVVRTFAMGKGGEAVFLASPTEIQRIALTKEKEETFLDEYGCLFSLLQSPQQKPKGFFESFFSSTPSPLDREELFGPKSGNVSRSVADYVPGCGVTNLRNQADSAAGAALKARQQLFERGEKLGILSERTEEMHEKAKSFASASQALAEKYKNKKWYQL